MNSEILQTAIETILNPVTGRSYYDLYRLDIEEAVLFSNYVLLHQILLSMAAVWKFKVPLAQKQL